MPRYAGRMARPRILVTVTIATRHPDAGLAERKNHLYADGIRRAGGEPVLLDGTASPSLRGAVFGSMDGLVLTGGADVDPERYRQPVAGAIDVEPERDALEAEAWAAAAGRGLPVLGLCRGMQLINVLMGGTLVQHIDGHQGPAYGRGTAMTHPIELVPGTRLAAILRPEGDAGHLEVNSYHHQAVEPSGLAPGLRVAALAAGPVPAVVEGLEADDDRLVIGVQCHPERIESTPPEFDGLWRAFVEACRREEPAPA